MFYKDFQLLRKASTTGANALRLIRMILYATKMGREGVLAAVSADGRVRQILKLHDGDVREPAWSVSR